MADNDGLWQNVRVVNQVKELHWQVVLHVEDSALVNEVVEVEDLVHCVASDHQVFRKHAFVKISLVETVLSVELQVPSHQEDVPFHVIDHQDLHQVLHSGRVNVLDPNFILETQTDEGLLLLDTVILRLLSSCVGNLFT